MVPWGVSNIMSVAFRGKWWWCDFYQQGIRIQKPFDGRDGRPKCGEEHTKKEALRAEALYRTHLESTPEKARLTLREVADRYWLEHGSKFRQAHSEASKLRNLLAILGEHTLFDMIGEPQLRHFIKTRETSHAVRRKRPPTPATINRAIAVYKRLYDRAKKWGIQFPTDSIDFDSLYLSEPKGRTRFLLPEEDAALMAVLAERFPDYVDMVNFAVITG